MTGNDWYRPEILATTLWAAVYWPALDYNLKVSPPEGWWDGFKNMTRKLNRYCWGSGFLFCQGEHFPQRHWAVVPNDWSEFCNIITCKIWKSCFFQSGESSTGGCRPNLESYPFCVYITKPFSRKKKRFVLLVFNVFLLNILISLFLRMLLVISYWKSTIHNRNIAWNLLEYCSLKWVNMD